jgi:WD40 repeat protein
MVQAYPETVLRGHRGEVQCVCFQQNGEVLFSGDSEGVVHAWKLATARSTQSETHSSNAGVLQVQTLGHGMLGTQGRDGEVKFWSVRQDGSLDFAGCVPGSGYHFCKFRTQHLHTLSNGSIPSACMVTFDSHAYAFHLWDLRHRKHGMTVVSGQEYGMAMCVQLASLGQPALICGVESGHAICWDLRNPQGVLAKVSLCTNPCFALDCKPASVAGPPAPVQKTTQPPGADKHPDAKSGALNEMESSSWNGGAPGCNILGGGTSNTAHDSNVQEDAVSEESLHADAVAQPLNLGSSATVLAAAGDQVSWLRLDSSHGTLHRISGCKLPKAGVGDICIRQDGRIAAVATWDGTTRIYHMRTSKQLGVLKHHKREVAACTFQPNSTCLATAGRDCVIALWNIPDRPRKQLVPTTVDV